VEKGEVGMKLNSKYKITLLVIGLILFTVLPVLSITWTNPTTGKDPADCSSKALPTMAGTQILVDGVLKTTVPWPGDTWDRRQLAPGTYVITTVAVSAFGLTSGSCNPNSTITKTITAAEHQAWLDENVAPGCTSNLVAQ